MEEVTENTTVPVKVKKAKPVVTKATRNGFGIEIKVGAITYRSVEQFAKAYAKKWKIDEKKAYASCIQRVKKGLTGPEMMKTPIRASSKEIANACRQAGMSYGVVYGRMKSGQTLEEALSKPVRPRSPNGIKKVERIIDTIDLAA